MAQTKEERRLGKNQAARRYLSKPDKLAQHKKSKKKWASKPDNKIRLRARSREDKRRRRTDPDYREKARQASERHRNIPGNLEKARQASQKWRDNPEKKTYALSKRKAKLYGITQEQIYDMITAAGGRCCGCDRLEKLVVDHDHATRKVRGVLCNRCNLALGYAKDDPRTLRALASYLEKQ